MSGTRWVEPGQGATISELQESLFAYTENGGWAVTGKRHAHIHEIRGNGTPEAWARCTNLALTGEPLTADDVRRIGEAK